MSAAVRVFVMTNYNASAHGGSGEMGGIEVTTAYMPLAFVLLFFPAKIFIDDGPEIPHGWGTKVYPIAPGRHRVRAYTPYFFIFKMGDATFDVDVQPGQVTGTKWKAPWLIFLAGVWEVLGLRPMQPGEGSAPAGIQPQAQPQPQPQMAEAAAAGGTAPAGWLPDPSGQHQVRYWDGNAWTEHVN